MGKRNESSYSCAIPLVSKYTIAKIRAISVPPFVET